MRLFLGKALEFLGICFAAMALGTGVVQGEMRGVPGALGKELHYLTIGAVLFIAGWLLERKAG